MLHGVQKDLAKCASDLLLLGVREITRFTVELKQAISSKNVAANGEPHPIRGGGDEFDAVIPTRLAHGDANHFRKLLCGKGTREITEGPFTNCRQNVTGNKFVSEDDQAGVWANHAKLAQEFDVLLRRGALAGNDQVVGIRLRGAQGFLVVGNKMDAPIGVVKQIGEKLVDLRAGVDNQRAMQFRTGRISLLRTRGKHRCIHKDLTSGDQLDEATTGAGKEQD